MMNDYEKSLLEERQAANAEVEYVLLSPFRWLISIGKWGALIIAVLLWQGSHWIFMQLGGESMEKRQAFADHISAIQVNSPNAPDRDWNSDTIVLDRRQLPGDYSPAVVFSKTGDRLIAGVYSYSGALVCAPNKDYDVTSGSWATRNVDAFNHKSALMQAAYDNSIIMVASERRIFTLLKLHPEAEPDLTNEMFFPGNSNSLCNADPDPLGMTPEDLAAEQEVSRKIKLYAPTVIVTHWHGKIVGMCLLMNCGENASKDGSVDLTYKVTWMDDVYGHFPPMTEGQQHAIEALNSLSTDWGWVSTAQANGIYQDQKVLRFAALARQYRDRIMWPNGQPPYLGIQ